MPFSANKCRHVSIIDAIALSAPNHDVRFSGNLRPINSASLKTSFPPPYFLQCSFMASCRNSSLTQRLMTPSPKVLSAQSGNLQGGSRWQKDQMLAFVPFLVL